MRRWGWEMLCCPRRWLWFRQEGREEQGSGLEVHLVLEGQGLDWVLGLELVLALGQGLQAPGLWLELEVEELELELELVLVLVLELELVLDLQQGVEAWYQELELELVLAWYQELELELDHFQALGLLALGQMEEPWALLPLLEPWASLELSQLDYHNRTFRAVTASSRCVWASQLSTLSGPATTRCGTQHASCVAPATSCWWT